MSQFYVALPSDSSADYYENNTLSYYTTKLAQSIRLEHDRWEVGLAELSYPVGFETLEDNILSKDKELTANVVVTQVGRVSFPQQDFTSFKELYNKIKSSISDKDADNLNTDVRLRILDATLFVKHVEVSPTISLAIEKTLLRKPAQYHTNRVDVKSVTVPKGSKSDAGWSLRRFTDLFSTADLCKNDRLAVRLFKRRFGSCPRCTRRGAQTCVPSLDIKDTDYQYFNYTMPSYVIITVAGSERVYTRPMSLKRHYHHTLIRQIHNGWLIARNGIKNTIYYYHAFLQIHQVTEKGGRIEGREGWRTLQTRGEVKFEAHIEARSSFAKLGEGGSGTLLPIFFAGRTRGRASLRPGVDTPSVSLLYLARAEVAGQASATC
uniref:Uncharacterized protein n=1 Tax=Timema shepardi TaxID=629360 RepID=A0A7R9AWJ9_TIMSH|nr:unnamed protein product [Timema shepardi]